MKTRRVQQKVPRGRRQTKLEQIPIEECPLGPEGRKNVKLPLISPPKKRRGRRPQKALAQHRQQVGSMNGKRWVATDNKRNLIRLKSGGLWGKTQLNDERGKRRGKRAEGCSKDRQKGKRSGGRAGKKQRSPGGNEAHLFEERQTRRGNRPEISATNRRPPTPST